MNESRFAARVGAFVVAAIVIVAVTLLVFSKGNTWFTPIYTLRLKAESVGGLKTRSSVLVSGVTVGRVLSTELSPRGKGVVILLQIHKRYNIHADAEFTVEQIGLLGDQFVVINPTENKAPLLKDGDEVVCQPPFSLQDLFRSSVGFVERIDSAVQMLNEAISRLNHVLLTEQTLTNLAHGIGNFRTISDKAVGLVDNLNSFLATNATPVTMSLTNFVRLSEQLNEASTDLRGFLGDNRTNVAAMVKNLEESARLVSHVAKDLEAGRGLAGSVLKDDQLQMNFSNAVSHLAVAASNIANYGLLYKPKKPKK